MNTFNRYDAYYRYDWRFTNGLNCGRTLTRTPRHPR